MKLLTLDLSTTNTGWAVFEEEKLIKYGDLKPKVKNPKVAGIPLHGYPFIQVLKIRDLVDKILQLIEEEDPTHIVVEEICRHKARMSGKTLDGLHFILADRIPPKYWKRLQYLDVAAWRKTLNIRLTEKDKEENKEIRKFNKKVQKSQRLKVISWKELSARYVKENYQVEDVSSDIADAICVGAGWLKDAK